ncbi:MAG: GspE/PulE family protein [Verrucomicrobiales bacterium]|nr:GspE/PulE family protein [Verrucomicrobiales bacterium]
MTANKNNAPEFSELSLFDISPVLSSFLPEDFCTSNHIALLDDPSAKDAQNIRIGVLDREDQDLIAKAQEIIGKKVEPVQLNAYEISKALSQIYNIEADSSAGTNLQLNSSSEIDFSKDRKPNLILQDILSIALQRRATDIHIENYNEDVDMRLRIDGTLHQVTTSLSPSNIQRVIACLKIVCDLDHLERRKSQDGRFSALYDDEGNSRKVDFRVSIVPGNHGQEAVIRVLDPKRFILDINELGMPSSILNSYKRLVNYPNGLILTTGPTSSGKTSTLYATVQSLVNRGLKIMTAEDPVEYEMDKVNQKSIDEFMDFSDYIRSFLRQNPDIILVGEIRDAETAEIAIKASTTGHLVLSSLHTRSAIGTVSRLRNLEIPDDYISDNLLGSIGQRLIRKICEECKEEQTQTDEMLSLFYDKKENVQHYHGKGCESCNGSGYKGMIGIYELFFPDEEISTAISNGTSVAELNNMSKDQGFVPLVDNALDKAHEGVTSLEEISLRIGPKFPHAN